MAELNITEEIIILMRGFFAMPAISSLARLGVLDNMLGILKFTLDDFPQIPNKKLLKNSFRYFARIGLLKLLDCQKDIYTVTELGKQIVQRASSFYVPHSYNRYMYNYHDLLLNNIDNKNIKVDRFENVIGSGKTHQRYFPPAISILKRRLQSDVIADLGCGDGHFLSAVLKNIPGKKIVGIDISPIAIDVTSKNLLSKYPQQNIKMICSDALDVRNWSAQLLDMTKRKRTVITAWFLLHEISKNNPSNVINFLKQIHKLFPDSSIIIGELVKQNEEILSQHRNKSIMPEYLFFHDFSGQGIISWEDYKKILDSIPYKLIYERLFDEISINNKGVPSAFMWCLQPA